MPACSSRDLTRGLPVRNQRGGQDAPTLHTHQTAPFRNGVQIAESQKLMEHHFVVAGPSSAGTFGGAAKLNSQNGNAAPLAQCLASDRRRAHR